MKNKTIIYITMVFSTLMILTACGGDGKNGAASEYNLLSETETPVPPVPPAPPAPEPVDDNHAPIAKIEGEFFKPFTGPEVIPLEGNGSSDPDGDPITYHWGLMKSPEGSNAKLSTVNEHNTSLSVDKPGIYRVVLMVRDGKENSPLDSTYILDFSEPKPKNQPPTAIAYVPQGTVMVNPDTITDVIMDGTFSTDDGLTDPLKYTWSNEGGELSGYARAKLEFSCSDDWQLCYGDKEDPICTFTNTLTVNDGELSDSTDLVVTVDYSHCAVPPVVEPPVAIADYRLCNLHSEEPPYDYWHNLDGSASTGDNLTYEWSIYLDGSLDDADRKIDPGSPVSYANFKVDSTAPGIDISAILIKLTVRNSAGESSTFVPAFPAAGCQVDPI